MAELTEVATAREAVLAAAPRLPAEETPLSEALGRVLAEDVGATLDVPPFDSSAMDGFALIAGPAAELEVVDESRAGRPAGQPVRPGCAIRISTGATVPEGADAVVPVERAEERDGRVRVPETRPGANVRRAGEDLRAGQPVLGTGTPLGPAELGVLASLGRERVRCARRPRLALVTTGDELAEPGRPLGPGEIYSSNAVALSAQARAAGALLVSAVTVGDDRAATESALAAGLQDADVLLVSGGVSVGPHDHVKPALAALGVEERFWGVRLKPGKPTWFGVRDDRLVFGLPGNPVSAMVCFQLFVLPALRAMQGASPDAPRVRARLAAPLPRSPQRLEAVRCRLRPVDGGLEAEATGDQGSHRLSSMLGANGLAMVTPGDGQLAAGELVEVELLGGGLASAG